MVGGYRLSRWGCILVTFLNTVLTVRGRSQELGRVVPQMSKEQGGRTLGTALHVLEALEFVGQHPKGVSAKKLARALGLSTSSAYSLLNSLRAENFVFPSSAESGLYVLGPEIVRLYKSYVESALQPERLVPYLEELRDRASCRAYVAVWNKGDLEVAEPARGARA